MDRQSEGGIERVFHEDGKVDTQGLVATGRILYSAEGSGQRLCWWNKEGMRTETQIPLPFSGGSRLSLDESRDRSRSGKILRSIWDKLSQRRQGLWGTILKNNGIQSQDSGDSVEAGRESRVR